MAIASQSHPRLSVGGFFGLLKDVGKSYGEDKVARLAAALAYYTIFSLSPLLVIALSLATIFYGEAAARGEISAQIDNAIGPTAAGAIEEILQNAHAAGSNNSSVFATVVGFLIALWGASNLFGALQDALNTVWGVQPKPDAGFMEMVRDRFLSFSMVLGIGFLLLVSLVASTALTAFTDAIAQSTGGAPWMFQVLNFVLAWALTSGLFMLMFKILPDAEIQWRDVFVGAVFTGLLFSVVRLLLSLYLGKSAPGSAFGSAGTLVALLLWINYSATIFLIGAEFTKAYANKFGSHIQPSEHAMAVTPDARAREGLTPHPSNPGVAGSAGRNGNRERGRNRNGNRNGSRDPRNRTSDGNSRDLNKRIPIARRGEVVDIRRERQNDSEFSLAVVIGSVLAALWALRRSKD